MQGLKEEIQKKPTQKYMEEARLQYQKFYLTTKLKLMGNNKEKLKQLIEKHNQNVVDYFEARLSEEIDKAENEGKEYKTPEYVKLVKDFWDRLYIFDQ